MGEVALYGGRFRLAKVQTSASPPDLGSWEMTDAFRSCALGSSDSVEQVSL